MSKNFCSVPWLDLGVLPTGHFGLCCTADHNAIKDKDRVSVSQPISTHWNTEYMKSVRRDFLTGIIPPVCKTCVRDESAGIMSRRHRLNQRYLSEFEPSEDNDVLKKLLALTNDDGETAAELQGLDLSLGDTCQLRCIQCSPSYSRSTLKDYEKLGWHYNQKNRLAIEPQFRLTKQDQTIQNVLGNIKTTIHTIRYIKFMGGEPSITKPLIEFLDWCIEHDHARNIVLLLATNAVKISDQFIDRLRKFQRVLLSISIDGVGALDEWIRFPTHWEKKTQNIHKLMQAFPDAHLSTTLFSLNIYGLPDLVEWARSKSYRHHIHLLNYPEPFALQHLPDSEKRYLSIMLHEFAQTLPEDHPDDRLSTDRRYRGFVSGLIKLMDSNARDPMQWKECLSIVNAYNKIRPISLQQCSPDWQRLHPVH